jgi:hypothetical protein
MKGRKAEGVVDTVTLTGVMMTGFSLDLLKR